VTGDVYAPRLAVSEGGVPEGHSYMREGRQPERGSVLPFAASMKKLHYCLEACTETGYLSIKPHKRSEAEWRL
jgi:hypothetical protein